MKKKVEKKSPLLPYLELLSGCLAIYFLIFHFAPWLTQNTNEPVLKYIQEKELDTSALFYTDSPEAVEGNFYMLKNQ